ncbi:MAG: DUF1501 domain-containing protein [Balneolaceae bacterium]|nr:DUF1501 domain-containing protein [Balneolaceae bacterium]MBO6547718.1 DUF1501 domain-containing protein [Balneolaceae bacterium]MBO6648229.1 DUF1501 domain-containing protein [Balneolaceae bacterium]
MCDHHNHKKLTLSHNRHGSSLEHGEAHEHDHQSWTRKSFLSTLGIGALGSGFMLGGLSVNAMARTKFLNRLVAANNDRVLILIQLGGGNDGLNTIVPVENDVYYQKRPTIAISKEESIMLSDDIGMHPAMASLEPIWGNGNMSVIHNVGYDNPNRSHARSTDIWTSASDENENLGTGWAGRFLVEDNPDFIANPPEFPLGVRIGGSATLFQSEFGNLGVTFGGASQFAQFLEQGGFYSEENVPANEFGRSLSFARKIANSSFKYLESIQNAADSSSNLGEYPNSGLARSLSVVARLIRGGLKTKVFLVSKGGFDTHNNQGSTEGGHANLLADIANSVNAFYADLEMDGQQDRALTMTFSEFGRTLDENSSQGTDHGSSAPVMLFGPVNGGLYGDHANLTDLDNSGDPVFSTDYRSIYTSILNNWFELDISETETVLQGEFQDLGFVEPLPVSTEVNGKVQKFTLHQNYPNPFNPSTNISFVLPASGLVSLKIYDVKGRLIQTLTERTMSVGEHTVTFDASDLPSGVYLYQLETPSGSQTRKMTLIK